VKRLIAVAVLLFSSAVAFTPEPAKAEPYYPSARSRGSPLMHG